jgi:uncharacterized membrane protein YGL010W
MDISRVKTHTHISFFELIGLFILCLGRAPALLDNVFQAFLQAPFFVWLEVLFKLGYRKDLQKSLDKEVTRELRRLRGLPRVPLPSQPGVAKSPKRKD